MFGKTHFSWISLGLCVFLSSAGIGIARAADVPPVIREYPIPAANPSSNYDLRDIAVAPNGHVWFTATGDHRLGDFDPAKSTPGTSNGIRQIDTTLPTVSTDANLSPLALAIAADGRVFFSANEGGTATGLWIVSPNPGGDVFSRRSNVQGGRAAGLAFSPLDNSLFATRPDDYTVARVSQNLDYTGSPSPTPVLQGLPGDVAVDALGNAWFTEGGLYNSGTSAIGLLPAGNTSAPKSFLTPTASSQPIAVTVDHSGNVWFAEFHSNKIGLLVPADAKDGTSAGITEFALPTTVGNPIDLTTAADGSIWFAEANSSQIGRLVPPAAGSTSATVTMYTLPGGGGPVAIAGDPAGNVWFGEVQLPPPSGVIGRPAAIGEVVAPSSTPPPSGTPPPAGTPPPSRTPPPTTTPPITTVVQGDTGTLRLTSSPVITNRNQVVQQVTCVKHATNGRCQVIMILETQELIDVAGFVASDSRAGNAGLKRKHKGRRYIVGRITVTLKAGQHRTLRVGLNSLGQRLLKRNRKLPITVTIEQATGHRTRVVKRAKLTFKAQAVRPRR